jgi:anti-sigma factor RsiW
MTEDRGISAAEPAGPAEDAHALVGAYALNAVEGDERAEFERHLAGCPLCTADVPAFREVIAALARASASAPPETLVAGAVAQARSVRQERARRRLLRFFPRRHVRGS